MFGSCNNRYSPVLGKFLKIRENRLLHEKVLKLTWPVIIANLSLPLAGAVDTAVVGHLPDPVYIGAVALGALIFSTFYWLVGFLRMGTTGFVAQSYGAGDHKEISAAFARGLGVAAVIGGLVILFQYPVGVAIFWFFEASENVEKFAFDYYGIRVWGAVFALFNLVIIGLLFGLQRMRTALILQLLLNGMNIVLDLVFVLGFGWAVAGVAFATVISEVVTAIVGLLICLKILGLSFRKLSMPEVLQKENLVRLAHVNINILIRSLCLEIVFIYFMWVSAKQGDVVLAANAILLHLLLFLAFGLDGFAHAAEALAGNAYGAKDRARLHRTVTVTLFWSFIVALCFCLAYLLLGDLIIGLMTSIDDVRITANEFLIWMIIAPFFCVWPFHYDGVYIGLTRTVEMRNCMIIAMALFFVVAHPGTTLVGNHGLWLGLMVFMLARGTVLMIWYRKIEAQVGKPT